MIPKIMIPNKLPLRISSEWNIFIVWHFRPSARPFIHIAAIDPGV